MVLKYSRSLIKGGKIINILIKTNFLKKENAFSLVEITVVMGIMALLTLLLATGMLTAGKQTRLRDATKTLQTNIRQIANNSISVSPDINDLTKPAKAWAIRIKSGENSEYDITDYYQNGSGDIVETTLPRTVNLEYGIKVYSNIVDDVTIIFSSPFADFNSREGIITGNWSKDDADVFTPPGSSSGDVLITLKDLEGETMAISVDGGTGEASIQ